MEPDHSTSLKPPCLWDGRKVQSGPHASEESLAHARDHLNVYRIHCSAVAAALKRT